MIRMTAGFSFMLRDFRQNLPDGEPGMAQ